MDDRNVPGKNTAPNKVRVFIEALSRLLALARRCCWIAISAFSLDSTWDINPFVCQFKKGPVSKVKHTRVRLW